MLSLWVNIWVSNKWLWSTYISLPIYLDLSHLEKDYKENPNYENGLAAFFQGGINLLNWIDRVPLIGEFIDEEALPDLEDPRYESTPEGYAFYEIIIWCINRVPPDYMGQMGFNYRDFMAEQMFHLLTGIK